MPIESLQPPLKGEPPSTYAITSWVQGEPGSFGRVVNLTLTRMLFIAPGVWLAGVREPKKALKVSGSVSLTISGGLALLYWLQKR
jgi:hypothetical protein